MTHLAPGMVESAYRYLTAAKHFRGEYDMLDTAQINAALGMEILLKSVISKPSHQGRSQAFESSRPDSGSSERQTT